MLSICLYVTVDEELSDGLTLTLIVDVSIDEFDKISEDDRRMMHPAMEQQQVHVAKGGITATLHSRCAILAAANPKDGRFSKRGPNQSVMRSFQETGLPPPLASRFDIIWMIRDEIRIHDDERIARHILDLSLIHI